MVDYLKTQPEVDVDEAVKATTPLYDQSVDLTAQLVFLLKMSSLALPKIGRNLQKLPRLDDPCF